MLKSSRALTTLLAISLVGLSPPAIADVVSPHVNAHGKTYSTERPNTAFYGTGMSGRLSEASALRFEGEQELQVGDIDRAIQILGKAVHLDPGDPTGHVLYARAITKKLYTDKGPIDEELLERAIAEWKMLWRHDADMLNQAEGRVQARKLMKIAKALKKKKKEQADTMLAEQRTQAGYTR